MRLITKDEVLARLTLMIREAGTQTKLAKKWGINPSYISGALNEQNYLGPAILDPMGLERVVLYVEKKD